MLHIGTYFFYIYKGASPAAEQGPMSKQMPPDNEKSPQKAVYDAEVPLQISRLVPDALKN